MKRRIATGDVEISGQDAGVLIEHSVCPDAGCKAMFGAERAQGDKCRCEFECRCGIELFGFVLCRDDFAVQRFDQYTLKTVKRRRARDWILCRATRAECEYQ